MPSQFGSSTPPPVVIVQQPSGAKIFVALVSPLEVGRDCDGLLIADSFISRRHLRLDVDNVIVTVTDLHTTNGTMFNGQPMLIPTVLAVGDVATFGRCRLWLKAGEDPPGP